MGWPFKSDPPPTEGKFAEGDPVNVVPGTELNPYGYEIEPGKHRVYNSIVPPKTYGTVIDKQGNLIGVKLPDGTEVYVTEESLNGNPFNG